MRKEEAFHEKKNHWKTKAGYQFKIISCYLFFGASIKGRKESIKEIADKITSLSQKYKLPRFINTCIQAKLCQMLNTNGVKHNIYYPLN